MLSFETRAGSYVFTRKYRQEYENSLKITKPQNVMVLEVDY